MEHQKLSRTGWVVSRVDPGSGVGVCLWIKEKQKKLEVRVLDQQTPLSQIRESLLEIRFRLVYRGC